MSALAEPKLSGDLQVAAAIAALRLAATDYKNATDHVEEAIAAVQDAVAVVGNFDNWGDVIATPLNELRGPGGHYLSLEYLKVGEFNDGCLRSMFDDGELSDPAQLLRCVDELEAFSVTAFEALGPNDDHRVKMRELLDAGRGNDAGHQTEEGNR